MCLHLIRYSACNENVREMFRDLHWGVAKQSSLNVRTLYWEMFGWLPLWQNHPVYTVECVSTFACSIRTQSPSINTCSRSLLCLWFSRNRNYGVNGSLNSAACPPSRKWKTELERYFTLFLIVEKKRAGCSLPPNNGSFVYHSARDSTFIFGTNAV